MSKCPECGRDHSQDGTIDVIRHFDPWRLANHYCVLMTEFLSSMQQDAAANRKGAFLSRLRDCEECYFKGLWVGLIATPDAVVHDASGKSPYLTLSELEKRVSKAVFGQEPVLSRNVERPGRPEFKAMDILNASTHLSALFLLHRSQLSDEDATRMYQRVLTSGQMRAAHLRYVFEALRAGKDKQHILAGIRSLRRK